MSACVDSASRHTFRKNYYIPYPKGMVQILTSWMFLTMCFEKHMLQKCRVWINRIWQETGFVHLNCVSLKCQRTTKLSVQSDQVS